ncbi:cysteine--tRNA ligase [Chitinivorax sp. PXF-14]|uniref:cysteine--tRNA ligase n=1 Tax=Chitinivorax sp. PXF-14 TaxID=3230488 RepID=UPI0034679B35
MDLHLYDTYSRSLRRFEPIHADHVGLYCCGPTVYDYAHIGNLRTYLFEDLLRRVLELNGHVVRHVVNITDVGHLVSDADDGEDKMEKGSRRTGESAWDIAGRFTAAFKADMAALNLREPTVWCRATDHIAEQIDFIATLEAKGFTYRTSDGLYFDTARQDDYGYLARLDRTGLQAGKRVDLGEKRSATDFALWKFSRLGEQRQMEWDSPWGRGFPGWHIECSAMSAKYLSPWFDIHCGGEDHIPVHHSNEIAQTEACHGTRLANFWLHGYFLQLDAAKMSKSSGDFLRLQTLLERGYAPLAYRYLCLTAHYRSQLSFTWNSLDAAQTALNRLREAYHSWPAGGEADAATLGRFRDELNHDLNAPKALALVWELVKGPLPPATKRATLSLIDEVLGLCLADWQAASADIPPAVERLAEQRQQARQDKRWADADALRGQITAAGYDVEDTPDGPRLRRAG